MRFLVIILLQLGLYGCSGCTEDSGASSAPTSDEAAPEAFETPKPDAELDELGRKGTVKMVVLKPGTTDPQVKKGKRLTVHYTGRFYDSKKVFDSSEERGSPFSFIVGSGHVIQGWELGVEGMKIGERREITVPAVLAFGDKGVTGIVPPKANLIYEIELISAE